MSDIPDGSRVVKIKISRVKCFCGKSICMSTRFQQGTCQNCGAYIAIKVSKKKIGMIWAYGEGPRVIQKPEITDWEYVE